MVRVLRAGHVYDGTRATRDLGLAYTPVEETLRRSIEWFRGEGLLS
jgi:dihydroflavonol-4-reductase